LVDSSVWIDFFNGRDSRETDLLALLLRRCVLLTGDLILGQVLQGFRQKREMEKARRALLSLPCVDMVGSEVALANATNYRLLPPAGHYSAQDNRRDHHHVLYPPRPRPAARRPRLSSRWPSIWPAYCVSPDRGTSRG
jgi:hypothetical protein